MPKILYIGMFGKLWDEEGIARGLEANGATVDRISEKEFVTSHYEEMINENGYDYALFAKLKIGAPQRKRVVEYAKEKGVFTTCLVPDLYWGLSREYRIRQDPIFQADLVLTPDGGERDWGKVNHQVFRQAIPDEFCYIDEPGKQYAHDVVFVGALNPEYPYRTQLVTNIQKRYKDFMWYGNTNPDEVRGHSLNKVYASAGVIIGESVYAPFYWSNRIYETLGRGGFCIHPNIPGLKDEYTPYEHFIPYHHGDFEGLFEIIDYYLKHPEKRKAIGLAAYEHTKKHHTQSVRCKQLLEVLRTAHNKLRAA
jgi:hypothetical protein